MDSYTTDVNTLVSPVAAPTGSPFKERSYFDGGMMELIVAVIVMSVISSFTLGLGTPWGLCMIYGWQINHTVVEGRRLHFVGTGGSLFKNWVKWFLLCVITFGIYGFWMGIALEKWKAENTVFG